MFLDRSLGLGVLKPDKDKIKSERETRLSENLRANLRRRKAAARKSKSVNIDEKDKSDIATESP